MHEYIHILSSQPVGSLFDITFISHFHTNFQWHRTHAFASYIISTFLARLLILIKKGGLLQLKFAASSASALTFTCGRDNLKSFSCFLPKFVLHVTNDHFSDKFNNG